MSKNYSYTTVTSIVKCDENGVVIWQYEEDDIERERAELAAKDARIAELVEFLKRCANDEFCDNDGRGCGSGFHAQDLLDKYDALAGEAQ